MDSAVTFIVLLGCCSVWTSAPGPGLGQSVSYSMVFSAGTQLLVHAGEETAACENKTKGSPSSVGPSIQILLSIPFTQSPGDRPPHLVVCLLSGLKSPLQDVLWWVNDTVMTSAGADMSLMRSEEGGVYRATSIWEVSPADWRSRSTYWCGTIQEGQVYREKLCSRD